MTTDVDLSIDRHLQYFMPPSMKDSDSSSSTLSTSDLFSEKSCEEQYEKDILEGILYRTTQDDSKTTMNFMSNAFFQMFQSKMKADFACSIEIDETSFISKYMTHVRGLKCEVVLDSHFCNITVSGIGHRAWRDYYFSRAARSLFKKHLQDADTRENESIESGIVSSGESTMESSGISSSDQSTTESSSMTSSDGSSTETSSVTLEDSHIFSSGNYIQPIHVSTPNAQSSSPNSYARGVKSSDTPTYRDDYGIINQQRCENDGRQLSFLVSKIEKMETEIQELRRSVINLMETMIKKPTYSEAVNRSETSVGTRSQPTSGVSKGVRRPNSSQDAEETNSLSIPAQKTQRQEMPQPIPVIINHGSNSRPPQQNNGKQVPTRNQIRQPRADSNTQKRVLLLGDSIIKGVNTKGLADGVHKHSNSGGNIQTLIDEISLYDLNAFSTIVIYIGGNNVARGDNPSTIEEKYDELISLIKCTNSSCKIILCNIAPRTDADVKNLNQAIDRLAMHWRCQGVEQVSDIHNMFLKKGVTDSRYFHPDGIHLTVSGTKRLLDAINRVFPLVKDFDNCAFNGKRIVNNGNAGSGFQAPQRNYPGPFQAGRRTMQGRVPLICFGCHRRGHKVADCWLNK